jgi:hypothetical protein
MNRSTHDFMSRTALFEGDESWPPAREAAFLQRRGRRRSLPRTSRVPCSPRNGMRLPIVAARFPHHVWLSTLFLPAMLPGWLCAIAVGGFVATSSRTPESLACRAHGACSWLFHTTNDADCRAASDCLKNGTCNADQGKCVARSQADCDLSLNCLQHGNCVQARDVWLSSVVRTGGTGRADAAA